MNMLICKYCRFHRKPDPFLEDICPVCGNELIAVSLPPDNIVKDDIQNETVGINEVIDRNIIAIFKEEIQDIGKEKSWKTIESLSNAETRLRYRKYFLLALEELKEKL